MKKGKHSVLVLGGGVAGLSAARILSQTEGLEVTVLEASHVLGGKGASTRNLEHGNRIEEHGLHVWLGFYHNAFRLLKEAWKDDPTPPFPRIWDAFTPMHKVTILDAHQNPRHVHFVPENDLPGDGDDSPPNLRQILRFLRAVLSSLPPGKTRKALLLLATFETAGTLALFESFPVLERLTRLLRKISLQHPAISLLLQDFYFIVAHLKGLYQAGIRNWEDDFTQLDHLEYRTWLRQNGASEESLAGGLIRAVYALAFSAEYPMAAGTGARIALRTILGWKGAFYYKMNAGMGEVVIGPLYRACKNQGVRFGFGAHVSDLKIQGKTIEEVQVDWQSPPSFAHEPQIMLEGKPVWREPRAMAFDWRFPTGITEGTRL